MRRAAWVRNERGIALPVVFLSMVIAFALVMSFLALSTSEPLIAVNQVAGHTAQYLAESGVENAIWALNNPGAAGGVGAGVPPLAPAPRYANTLPHGPSSVFVGLGAGGYTVTLEFPPAAGLAAGQARVTSTGWLPDNANPTAKRIVQAILTTFPWGRLNPPGAMTVLGSLSLGGSSSVSGNPTPPPACGLKYGAVAGGTVATSGAAIISGVPASYLATQPASAFTSSTLSANELQALKALAQASGHYYQGTQSFSSVPNGIVFVDTVSGAPIGSPPNASDLAQVTVTGASTSGWLIVMGSLRIDGNVSYNGMIYVADSLTYHGTGSGGITGAVITQNVVNTQSSIDQDIGNANITFNCSALAPPSGVPTGYIVLPRTWYELPG